MAISVAPLTTTVMNAVERKHAGIASGINNAIARSAGLLALAVLGLVMSHTFNSSLDRRLASAHISSELKREMNDQRIKVTGMKIPAGTDAATQAVLQRAIAESFIAGFRRVMLIATVLALLSALSAWFVFRGEASSAAAAHGRGG
jgi:hypothetical protein